MRVASQLHIGAFIIGRGALALYTKKHLGASPPEVNPGGPVPEGVLITRIADIRSAFTLPHPTGSGWHGQVSG